MSSRGEEQNTEWRGPLEGEASHQIPVRSRKKTTCAQYHTTATTMSPTATNENGSSANGARAKLDDKAAPYQGEQPYGMPNDLVIPSIMDIDGTDERLWVRWRLLPTVHQGIS